MCPSQRILQQTKNGILTFCNHSKLFQLSFNNLCFEFYEWELEAFKAHLEEIDTPYWENQMRCTIHKRKIPISVGCKHFIVLITRQELSEMKNLLDIAPSKIELLATKDIDYQYIEN